MDGAVGSRTIDLRSVGFVMGVWWERGEEVVSGRGARGREIELR